MKDLKGLLFLFKTKDNLVTYKDFTSIFYHLGTFNYNLVDRLKANSMPNTRMRHEIHFEDELWY